MSFIHKTDKLDRIYESMISERKADNEEIKWKIEDEGIGYAIQNYFDIKDIEDPKLKVLWKKADDALSAIKNYLGI